MRRVLVIVFAFAAVLSVRCLAAENGAKPGSSPSSSSAVSRAQQYRITGQVLEANGAAITGARVSAAGIESVTDAQGNFELQLEAGEQRLSISADGYAPFSVNLSVTEDSELTLHLQPAATTTVTAQPGISATAAVNQIYDSADLLPNPSGQPGVPARLPGLPSETASGGVKAPQYFAPGVAGDHGEPIAQYIQVGEFQFPNNLPANAHGNGYADPNLLIANAIGFVEADPGAFDVRHGNNAVDLAVGYGLVPRWEPFTQVSLDPRNYDFVSGLAPSNPSTPAWLGFEVAGGNGFLNLPEHRRQYKLNAERIFTMGRHTLSVVGAGYFGKSRIPGLVPLDARLPSDTVDPRQSDRTHTELIIASDTWNIDQRRELSVSTYFRAYGLNLKSNFGDGLIRQSEFRTVTGGNASYTQHLNSKISFIAGVDFRRDAPRNAELAHADAFGFFQPVTRNNFVIGDVAPYASISGPLSRWFDYTLGVRHDQVWFSNADLMFPASSYQANAGLTSPRATFSFHLPRKFVPVVAFSSGEAFHSNDPRTGLGNTRGTAIERSHSNQLLIKEDVAATEFRMALTRSTNSDEMAKIDPDTGLQEDVGPSLIRSLTFSARRRLSFATVAGTFARAQAKDLLTMTDVPEAPRAIYDFSATSIRLPWRLQASAGFEYVGRKPLGDGFVGVPVREIRGVFTRSFNNGLDASLHFLAPSGATGQTVETLQLPGESFPFERVVGVRQASYGGITFHYNFHRR